MRAQSKQIFEYDNRSVQGPESQCRDSLGFSIKLIKVELDSKCSGKTSITGKSIPYSDPSTLNGGRQDGGRESQQPSEKASEEMEYALDQPGSGEAGKGMKSIFNLNHDEMLEMLPTAE